MDNEVLQQQIKHLQSILDTYEKYVQKGENFLEERRAHGIIARSVNAIEKISGPHSSYRIQMIRVLDEHSSNVYKAELLTGIMEALKEDLETGNLDSIEELVHARVFNDFLDMADYLCSEGYKDASAVIAGSTLEGHIRQLCIKHGIDLEISTEGKSNQPKKASRMNQDLGSNVYSKFNQKLVSAWLDIRNNAAHGNYSEYSKDQVSMMIEGIRDFVRKNPA